MSRYLQQHFSAYRFLAVLFLSAALFAAPCIAHAHGNHFLASSSHSHADSNSDDSHSHSNDHGSCLDQIAKPSPYQISLMASPLMTVSSDEVVPTPL